VDIAKLREEFAKVQKEALDVIAGAEKDSRDLTGEENEANEKRFARLTTIKRTIDDAAKFAKLAYEAGDIQLPQEPSGKEEFATVQGAKALDLNSKIDHAEFNAATKAWALTGRMADKFATITTATSSGILLPSSVISPLVVAAANAFREAYDAWGVSPVSTPNDGSQIKLPIIDPTAGNQVAENASSETENAPSFSESIVSNVKTYQSGSVYYSGLELMATKFDLLSATVPSLRANKELALESTIAAAIVADAGVTQVVNTATTTGFTYANSVSLANKLPKRYQKFKVRLLSPDFYQAAEGLVDGVNRPVLVTDPQNQTLRRMHGTPTFRCDYLEAFGSSKVGGLEFSLIGFHLRDAGEGFIRYDQVRDRPAQIGINVFGYHAYGYAPSAMVKFKTPVS
jgi:HK97 family phage major capsid protein